MQFEIDSEDELFRSEVRAFLQKHLSQELAIRNSRGYHFMREDMRRWTKVLNQHGYSGANWPASWGGTGWSPLRQFIFDEECFLAGAPPVDTGGFKMIGPVIMTFGSDAMKAKYGPLILNGDIFWGQGFSEPNAGSDLASLTTRAMRDGDEYVINGQKIWTSFVESAEMIFLLAKTDPEARQRGISMILVERDTPGVTVRPIHDIGESHSLNEVFFDNVRVPVENLVGEEGKGWTYAKFLLENERAFSAEWPRNNANLTRLKHILNTVQQDGSRLIDLPGFASRVALLETDLQALRWLSLRALHEKADGRSNLPIGSLLKIRGSELLQKIGDLQIEALGSYANYVYLDPQGSPEIENSWVSGPDYAPGIMADYLYRRATTVYGGANEVQRTIIARSFLEM
ncbi:acyl-CoA dehydrogenase [Pseudomonas sp. WN033]|nr:acyl-CoA dehydrogenase [Pseudomonas sp. WN033]